MEIEKKNNLSNIKRAIFQIVQDMKNIIKISLIVIVLFGIGFSCLAQEMPEILLDEDIDASDLGIGKPRMLPDHPLYFLKNGWRKLREFFTFNPIAKINLKEKYASERIIELKELVKKGASPEAIKKATDYYKQESEEIKNRVMELKQNAQENPQINSFLEKFIHQETLHYQILQKLENQVPSEVSEKIKEQREAHLERFKDVMLKLEEKEKIPEKLEDILGKIEGSEFKDFKNLEMLEELEEKVPEEVRGKIKEVEENVLKKFQEKLEVMSSEKQEGFQEYLEKISGSKEKHLEILENLRFELKEKPQVEEKLLEIREEILKEITEAKPASDCPQLTPPHSNFCKKGRVVVEKDPKTECFLPPKCIIPGEIGCETFITCVKGYIPQSTGEEDSQGCPIMKCVKETEEKPEEEIMCISLWDPVCGTDGKTYSNECFTKMAEVEIDYKGVCKENVLEEVELDENDNNRQITLKKNQILIINLNSNPSTGYTWEIVEMNESVLQKTEEEFYQESELLGAPGKQIFRFEASEEGQSILKLVYHRPWEKEEAEKTFSIQVTVTEESLCGGWNTFEEVVCECRGRLDKDICPQDAVCDGEIYKCYGTCGECKCYEGSAEGGREIPCGGRDEFFK